MEDHITSIRYNAGKLDALKRAFVFFFLLAVMLYSWYQTGFSWNKQNLFFVAFSFFILLVLGIGMTGYKKNRTRSLSVTSWKYRLYKNTNATIYLIVRGIITTLIFVVLFAVMQIKSNGIDAVMEKTKSFYLIIPVFILIAGAYHLMIMLYIIRTGTPESDNQN